jgi:hypothetical protein
MQFHNTKFGDAAKPFAKSPYAQPFETQGNPLPPAQCLLIDQAGDFIITMGDNSNVLVHCPQPDLFQVVDINANNVIDINNNRVVAI